MKYKNINNYIVMQMQKLVPKEKRNYQLYMFKKNIRKYNWDLNNIDPKIYNIFFVYGNIKVLNYLNENIDIVKNEQDFARNLIFLTMSNYYDELEEIYTNALDKNNNYCMNKINQELQDSIIRVMSYKTLSNLYKRKILNTNDVKNMMLKHLSTFKSYSWQHNYNNILNFLIKNEIFDIDFFLKQQIQFTNNNDLKVKKEMIISYYELNILKRKCNKFEIMKLKNEQELAKVLK